MHYELIFVTCTSTYLPSTPAIITLSNRHVFFQVIHRDWNSVWIHSTRGLNIFQVLCWRVNRLTLDFFLCSQWGCCGFLLQVQPDGFYSTGLIPKQKVDEWCLGASLPLWVKLPPWGLHRGSVCMCCIVYSLTIEGPTAINFNSKWRCAGSEPGCSTHR